MLPRGAEEEFVGSGRSEVPVAGLAAQSVLRHASFTQRETLQQLSFMASVSGKYSNK